MFQISYTIFQYFRWSFIVIEWNNFTECLFSRFLIYLGSKKLKIGHGQDICRQTSFLNKPYIDLLPNKTNLRKFKKGSVFKVCSKQYKFIKNQCWACLLMSCPRLLYVTAQYYLVVNSSGKSHKKQDQRKKRKFRGQM